MIELTVLIAVTTLAMITFWLLTDSDDDNRGGGLKEPVLIPIQLREGQNKK